MRLEREDELRSTGGLYQTLHLDFIIYIYISSNNKVHILSSSTASIYLWIEQHPEDKGE